MSARRPRAGHFVYAAACTLGLLLGSLLSTAACTLCRCPELLPLALGSAEVTEAPSDPALVGARIEFREADVEVSYSRAGEDWVVRYRVDSRSPEDD